MMNAASTSNPSFMKDVGEAYPYPSHVIAPNFVTVKLSGKNKYNMWKTQMLCLLRSHQMYGFVDGHFPSPVGNGKGKVGDLEAWIISDSLVKGWILGSLSEEAVNKVVNHLTYKHKNTYFTAKDLWDELQRRYGPSVREQAAGTIFPFREQAADIFPWGEICIWTRCAIIVLSIFLITAPVVAFCVFVARKLLDEFDHHLGVLVMAAVIVFTIYVVILLLVTSGRDPGIIPRSLHPPEPEVMDQSIEIGSSQTPQLRLPRFKEVMGAAAVFERGDYCDDLCCAK